MMPGDPDPILLSRTDNIGDVVLTLPMAGWIKRNAPPREVIFLGRDYTRPILEACEHVDSIVSWDDLRASGFREAVAALRSLRAGAIVHVFPRREIARLARSAGIPQRIGVNRRWYHLLECNRLVNLSRRRSSLHEAQLNLRLLEPLLGSVRPTRDEIPDLYGLRPTAELPSDVAAACSDRGRGLFVLHPCSGGSAQEWGLENFARLVRRLVALGGRVIVTGSEAEGASFRGRLPLDLDGVTDLSGRLRLDQLLTLIAGADGLVAASTGPLHLAAALGVVAVGLYVPQRPIHPGRWGPLGRRAVALVAPARRTEPAPTEGSGSLAAIPVHRVIEALGLRP